MTVFRDYRWRKRLLLVCAPDRHHLACRRQHDVLTLARGDLDDRDTLVITVLQDTVSIQERPLLGTPAADIRNAFAVDPAAFQVLLIGKDGGVKLRRGVPLSAARVIARIDAMPMRRREMQREL